MLRLFNRYGPIVIFIFALTPLPDDLLFIPLGIMRFNLVRAFVPALLGKILMCLILAYAGKTSFKLVLAAYGESSLIGVAVITLALAGLIYLMMKTDWEKLAEKYGADILKSVEGTDTKAT
jgi:membrane protein DedA with SNARE-associated domain